MSFLYSCVAYVLLFNLLIINYLQFYIWRKIRNFITDYQSVMKATKIPTDCILSDKEMKSLKTYNERQRRQFLASKADSMGCHGVNYVCNAIIQMRTRFASFVMAVVLMHARTILSNSLLWNLHPQSVSISLCSITHHIVLSTTLLNIVCLVQSQEVGAEHRSGLLRTQGAELRQLPPRKDFPLSLQ